ncbi:MAG: hypothetical protein WDZ59_01770 [Pirellulales bacterium]
MLRVWSPPVSTTSTALRLDPPSRPALRIFAPEMFDAQAAGASGEGNSPPSTRRTGRSVPRERTAEYYALRLRLLRLIVDNEDARKIKPR